MFWLYLNSGYSTSNPNTGFGMITYVDTYMISLFKSGTGVEWLEVTWTGF